MKNLQLWIIFGVIGLADALLLHAYFDGPKWAAWAVLSIALYFPLYADLTKTENK